MKREQGRAGDKPRALKSMLANAWQKDRGLFSLCGLHSLAAVGGPLLMVLLPRLVIQELQSPAASREGLLRILIGFILLASLLYFFNQYTLGLGRPRIVALRIGYVRDLSVKLIEMDYQHSEDAGFMARWQMAYESIGSDSDGMESIYRRLFHLPQLLVLALLLSLLLGFLHPLILLGILLHAGASFYLQAKAQDYAYGRRQDLSEESRRASHYGSAAQDFRYGKDVRLYDLRERVIHSFEGVIAGYRKVFRAVQRRELRLGLLSLPLLLLSDLLTYGLLARAVQGGLPIADFSMYLMAAIRLKGEMNMLSDALSDIRRGYLYVAEFYRFMNTDLSTQGGPLPAVPEGQALDIRFEDVSFRYPGSDRDILKDFSLHIPAGQRLALVGINGAGKSTMVKLICGFFKPQQGRVLLNGQPVEAYSKEGLYTMLSAVFQEVNLLGFTVAENVAGCKEGIDRQRVQAALQEMGLWDKISALEKGMDSMLLRVIEEDGLMLSGGEQQKLAIARALYKGGNCIILDEPTAALDALAEQELYSSFNRLTEGRTAIYISHRLASTQFCDRIALIDGAGLRQYGSHQELMQEDGPYREMFTMQARHYQEVAQA